MTSRIFPAMIILVTLFINFFAIPPVKSNGQGDDCGGPSVTISKPSAWDRDNSLKGRGAVKNLKDVLIFAADVEYNSQCYESDLKTFILSEFILTLDVTTTVKPDSWQKVFLVIDGNGNLKSDSDEERFPITVSAQALIANNLAIRLPLRQKKTFLIIADFSEIKGDDVIAVRLHYSKNAKIEPVEVKPRYGSWYVNVSFNELTTHYRGYRIPELFFSWQAPYNRKYAVFPGVGSPQEEFEFFVYYRDEDGDKPARAEVWIDENGDGKFDPKERFPMIDQKPEADFKTLHPFSFKKTFLGSSQKSLSFKFYFADADSPAIKGRSGDGLDPAMIFNIQFNHNVLIQVGKTREKGYLPGEIIPVKIEVLVYWQGAIDIDWNDFRKNASSKLSVFKGITTGGERRYFNEFYDIEETTIFLEAPNIRAEKKYTIDLPPLSFVAKVDGRTGKATMPRFDIAITLKPRVEGPFVDQVSVRVGEPIIYRIRSVRLADAPRPQELERLTFKPFVETKREIKKTQTRDLIIEDFIFTLMLFENGGEYSIPAFKFPFGEIAGLKVTLLPSKGAKKIDLPYSEQNLRTVQTLSLLKPEMIIFAASLLILLLIVRQPICSGVLAITKLRWSWAWQDHAREARNRIQGSLRNAKENPNREALLDVYYNIREYFVIITDLKGIEKSSGTDARTFRETLQEFVDSSLLDIFVELEDALTSSVEVSGRIESFIVKLNQAKLDQSNSVMYF